jgi:uncharacterized lipoprotein YmbA
MRSTHLMYLIGLVTALATQVGCAGKIRYPSYYVLSLPAPVAVSTRSTPILGPVAVREFSAPAFLRSGQIVYRPSAEQVDFYDYHRWAEDPRRVVSAAMVQEIRARRLFQSVDMFDGRGSPEYLVTGTVDHLEEIDQGATVSIEVSLSAQLINLQTGHMLWQDRASKTTRLDQRSVPGIVAEMSRDLKDAVERLVSSMQGCVAAVSASLSTLNKE